MNKATIRKVGSLVGLAVCAVAATVALLVRFLQGATEFDLYRAMVDGGLPGLVYGFAVFGMPVAMVVGFLVAPSLARVSRHNAALIVLAVALAAVPLGALVGGAVFGGAWMPLYAFFGTVALGPIAFPFTVLMSAAGAATLRRIVRRMDAHVLTEAR